MEKRETIAVVFGGRSAEHDVSIITAHIPIIKSLLASGKYEVVPVYIAKDGSWYTDEDMNNMEFFKDSDYESKLNKKNRLQLKFDDGLKLSTGGMWSKPIEVDLVFPAMHGTYGEDGSLMGLLRLANVPFVGCDLFASAVAMDKVLTKQVAASEGIPVVPYVWFTKKDWEENESECLRRANEVGEELFVKPVHLGSSIAITKTRNETELKNAIEVAFHYDEKVLVEKSVPNLIEVTLPVMGNEEIQFASIERPLNQSDFFDFGDKYLSGGKKSGGVNSQYSEIPAKIDDELSKLVRDYAEKAYKTLGCSGTARLDFLIDGESNTVYLNEINTLPGSLYDHNWKQSGVSNVELVNRLVELAKERFAKQSALTQVFETDILKHGGGAKLG